MAQTGILFTRTGMQMTLADESSEYKAFEDKFKPKKTTDTDETSLYNNAKGFFEACRRSVKSLKAVRDQLDSLIDDGYGTVSGVRYDREGGGSKPDTGDEAMLMAVERMDAVRRKMESTADRYSFLLYTAEQSIALFEQNREDADNDVAIIRYYYLQLRPDGRYYTLAEVGRKVGYSDKYMLEKIEIVLNRIAPYVPLSW